MRFFWGTRFSGWDCGLGVSRLFLLWIFPLLKRSQDVEQLQAGDLFEVDDAAKPEAADSGRMLVWWQLENPTCLGFVFGPGMGGGGPKKGFCGAHPIFSGETRGPLFMSFGE